MFEGRDIFVEGTSVAPAVFFFFFLNLVPTSIFPSNTGLGMLKNLTLALVWDELLTLFPSLNPLLMLVVLWQIF